MAGEHELNQDVDIDLGGIFASVWRNKFKIFLASLIVTLLTFALLQVISPRYRSEARILIRQSDSVLEAGSSSRQNAQSELDDPGIASQVQLLQSRTIARKIVKTLKLKDSAEFDPLLKRSALDRILSIAGLSENGRGVTAEDRALDTYFDRLKVFQAERSRVIVVKFWSKDPKLAATIPNMIADEYLALQEELKRGAGPDELQKLEPELKELRASVLNAEAAVAEFRSSSDLLQGRDNASLATQELSELSTELGRVRAQLSRAEANAAAVSRALQSGSLDAAPSVLQSPLIQRLRERQVTLNSQLSELSTTLLSGHPRIQRLRSQISTLNSQINREVSKIESSLQEEAEVAREREQDLVQRRNQLKSEAGRVGKAQVDLRALEREAEAQRQLLNTYLVRFKEAKSRQNRDFLPADAYVFSRAQIQSKPYFPKKLPMLLGAFFGTFLLGSLITLAAAVLTNSSARQLQMDRYYAMRQHEPALAPHGTSHGTLHGMRENPPLGDDVYPAELQQTHTPPLAPAMESLTQPVHAANPNGTTSVQKTVRSMMILGKARIAMLSPDGDEGSQTTVALARYLAGQGPSVVVLDMTGSGASSRVILGSDEMVGVKDLLAGTAGFGQALHADSASDVHIMPTGTMTAQLTAESATRLPGILDALQQSYDYVIVDCGAADAAGLKRVSTPATINILNANGGEQDTISMVSEMLRHAGFRAPLVVHATQEERQLMGLEVA